MFIILKNTYCFGHNLWGGFTFGHIWLIESLYRIIAIETKSLCLKNVVVFIMKHDLPMLFTLLSEYHNHPCKSHDHDKQWADLVMT